MSKRSWIEEQCFRICSAEGVECKCKADCKAKTDLIVRSDIVAQDHIEPEVVVPIQGDEDDQS